MAQSRGFGRGVKVHKTQSRGFGRGVKVYREGAVTRGS